jgi:hypothetical protein
MGAWGAAIFSDDTAADVRDAYRALLAEGYSGPKATAQLLWDWKETLADEDDAPIFWLALAATQWQCGRLEARVRAKALRIIDQGSSLARWSEGNPRSLKRRQAALEKLRRQLHSPQPAPKEFRKRREPAGDWRVGEVLAYRLRSGRRVLLHIVNPGRGSLAGKAPIFAVLDWIGDTHPAATAIQSLPLKNDPNRIGTGSEPYVFMPVGRLDKKLAARLTPLGVQRKPHAKVTGGFEAFLWKNLDGELARQLGWK